MDPHAKQKVSPILKKVRSLCLRRGPQGLKEIQTLFNRQSRPLAKNAKELKMNPDEFREELKRFAVILTNPEFETLHSAFRDPVGYFCVDMFIEHLLDNLSSARENVVDQAFRRMDTEGKGVVTLDDVRRRLDPTKHPLVRSGLKTPDDILADIVAVFEPKASSTGKVTAIPKCEFRALYAGVSEEVADEQEFVKMVMELWKLDRPPTPPQKKVFVPDAGSGGGKGVGAASLTVGTGTATEFTSTAGGIDPRASVTEVNSGAITKPKRIAGYTGHVPYAQDMYGESFHRIDCAVPELKKKPPTWLTGSFVDDANAFVKKGNKANQHSFKLA